MSRNDPPALLVINAGSSSLKFALYALGAGPDGKAVLSGEVSGLPTSPRLSWRDARAGTHAEHNLELGDDAHGAALAGVLEMLAQHAGDHHLLAVGHRVVHGGTRFSAPLVIDATTLDALEDLVPLAPLHQPYNLAAIRTLMARLPKAMQVACFDTAFHQSCPDEAQRFALPRQMHDEGIRRYGFHGLSYEYIAHTLGNAIPRRTIVAHLGAGASLCALLDGKSHATTMGFTALDGLMMGTRCGAIDPGVLLHLQATRGISTQALSDLLYHRSGLLGVSGISADMRELLASPDAHARQAVDLFCYRVIRELGSLTAALGGLDALIFTAGIGERSAEIRSRICGKLEWLGVRLDREANANNSTLISRADSAICVRVIPTDEQGMIAMHTQRLLTHSDVPTTPH